MNPEFYIAQAKYENYRIAVDKGYKIAENLVDWNNFTYVSDAADGTRLYKLEQSTNEHRIANLTAMARLLIPAIYEDLEKATAILDKAVSKKEEKKDASSLSRPT